MRNGYVKKLDTFSRDGIILLVTHTSNQHVSLQKVCVQTFGFSNTNTTLFGIIIECKDLNLKDLKHLNKRTTGSNLTNITSGTLGRRSFRSTYIKNKEGKQRKFSPQTIGRATLTTFPNFNNKELLGDGLTNLFETIRNSKNKDNRYGNLYKLISSETTLTLAYAKIRANPGNTTDNTKEPSLDAINPKYIKNLSLELRKHKFVPLPTRRVYIPKPGKKELRPLGIVNPRQKLVEKAIELILSYIYEQIFLNNSHDFRPKRGCHTAINFLQIHIGNSSNFRWAIEGDITKCFDRIPHYTLIKLLNRTIDCPSTILLITKILKAGYLDPIFSHKTNQHTKRYKLITSDIGTPQGSVLSPLLSNLVLHELDTYINSEIKKKFQIGKTRKANDVYRRAKYQFDKSIKLQKPTKVKHALKNKLMKIPSKIIKDPNFKRFHYVRYADDWILLLDGSYRDAKTIVHLITNKLLGLGLELNKTKTNITDLYTNKAHFLGHDIFKRRITASNQKPTATKIVKGRKDRFRATPRLILHAPIKKLIDKLVTYGFVKRNRLNQYFPTSKSNCIPLTHPQIINFYNSKIRGILNYYQMVHNRNRLWSIHRMLRESCALTLARKYKLKTIRKAYAKFGPDLKTQTTSINHKNSEQKKPTKVYSFYKPDNLKTLDSNKRYNLNTEFTKQGIDTILRQTWTSSMTNTLFDQPCAICNTLENIEIHHVRSVKKLRNKKNTYDQWIGGFSRKTLPLCKQHHQMYHARKLSQEELKRIYNYNFK